MSDGEHDAELSEFAINDATDSELSRVAKLGEELVQLDTKIAETKMRLEILQRQHDYISDVQLPDAMREVGMTEFVLENGFKIGVYPIVSCRLIKERIADTEKWLDEHGHTGLMKHLVKVEVPKGIDKAQLLKLKAAISHSGFDLIDERSIHHQTLNKWAREMIEQGEVIPDDYFEVWNGFKSRIIS